MKNLQFWELLANLENCPIKPSALVYKEKDYCVVSIILLQ